MKTSIMVLIASLLVAIASWGSGFNNWAELKAIGNIFSLVGVIGGVVLAWLGQSPIKPSSK